MEHGFVLLGGDTVAPSGLYARLCHAFLVQLVVGAWGRERDRQTDKS